MLDHDSKVSRSAISRTTGRAWTKRIQCTECDEMEFSGMEAVLPPIA